RNLWATFKQSIWGLLMPLIILGGIFSGYFTPSEAAAVAVVYSMIVSMFVYRDLTLKELGKIMLGSAKTSAIIMIIIACSGVFGWVLANWKIPEAVAQAILSISSNKYIVLFLIAIIILIAGIFMETSSAVILLTPVFLPLMRALGVDLVHFGVIFTVGISIGMITPPVAINLFVGSSITGIPIEQIAKAVWPYLLGLIVAFLLYIYMPLFISALLF
ncbi:MAG: TRAP transporter large permease subunit, partial [Clostridiales bacterium]|nr:TRAP transporter large permease subunit [Clostridiales bacterium]